MYPSYEDVKKYQAERRSRSLWKYRTQHQSPTRIPTARHQTVEPVSANRACQPRQTAVTN